MWCSMLGPSALRSAQGQKWLRLCVPTQWGRYKWSKLGPLNPESISASSVHNLLEATLQPLAARPGETSLGCCKEGGGWCLCSPWWAVAWCAPASS